MMHDILVVEDFQAGIFCRNYEKYITENKGHIKKIITVIATSHILRMNERRREILSFKFEYDSNITNFA